MATTPKTAAVPAMDDHWQAEDDHRTMMRAAEIMADSKRMAGVHRHQAKAMKAASTMSKMLAGLKLHGALKGRGSR